MVEVIGIVLGILTLVGGMVATWVNLNLKIKELEVQMQNIKLEQSNLSERMDKNEVYSREDHKNLDTKLDRILESLTKLLAEHEVQKCNYLNEKFKK